MTLALLALGLAVLAWPGSRRGEARLGGLVGAGRLAEPVEVRGRPWSPAGVRAWLSSPAGMRAWPWSPALARGRSQPDPVRGRPQPGPVRGRSQPAGPSRLAVCAGAGCAGVLATMWRGPFLGMASGVAAALVLSCVTRAARRSAARSCDRDLSAALRLLRAELEVGSTGDVALAAAAQVAGAHGRAFEAGAAAVRDGADVVAAMSGAGGAAERDLIVVATAWQLAAELGVPLAGVLARVDEDVQARRAQSRVVGSALAGPRSSAALLAGLPVLGVVLGMAMGAHPLRVLFDSPGGRMLLCAGVLLDATGVAWTARLVDSAERS